MKTSPPLIRSKRLAAWLVLSLAPLVGPALADGPPAPVGEVQSLHQAIADLTATYGPR